MAFLPVPLIFLVQKPVITESLGAGSLLRRDKMRERIHFENHSHAYDQVLSVTPLPQPSLRMNPRDSTLVSWFPHLRCDLRPAATWPSKCIFLC